MQAVLPPNLTLVPPALALTRGFVDAPRAAATSGAPTAHDASHELRQAFRCGPLRLMVRYEDGSELTEMPPVYKLPNTPEWFLGIANLHGLLVPVFDLARFAGVQAPEPQQAYLLVLSHGDDSAGVVIEGLPRRLRILPHEHTGTDAAPQGLAPYLRGGALTAGELWLDLDRAALLDAFERALDDTLPGA
ncbi:chemotaxis protein CheW [Ramlibacter albus]|uniref:Chemotaxis protein CheW n=1 Tax=Ramlibacter albus TaxID=2079448 RepID=A0A923MDJ1_9BURK|nr:chemotaxis protein CheW [Ramlibacter albus]MBC5768040.1 chemotaxis protein CheW [Ramlibacter albus]